MPAHRARAGAAGAAGEARYAGGFLDHYVLSPLGLRAVVDRACRSGIYAVAVLPNVLAYGLLRGAASARRALPRRGVR